MANPDTPFGLRPVRHKSGAPYNGAVNPYFIISTNGTATFIGDPVVRVAGGSNTAVISVVGAGDFAIGTLPSVIVSDFVGTSSAAADMITGVIVSFAADPTALENVHRLASTERVCWVCDDPDIVFEIQANGAITAAEIGLNATMIADHTGSTTTGLSGAELDTTSQIPAADISDQLRIVRAVNRVDNDTTLTHAKVEVVINQHTESQNWFSATGTAGSIGI